jgi:hypothetical protein
MNDMTVEEFVTKTIEDKSFMQQVAQNCADVNLQDDNGLATAVHTAATRMGHTYDFNELGLILSTKVKGLGVFGVVKFVRAFSKAHKKAGKDNA